MTIKFSAPDPLWSCTILFAYIYFLGGIEVGRLESRIVRFHDCYIILKRLSFTDRNQLKSIFAAHVHRIHLIIVHIISKSLCKISRFRTAFDRYTLPKNSNCFLIFQRTRYISWILQFSLLSFFYSLIVKNRTQCTK